MSSLLSPCLHTLSSRTGCRSALLHTSAVLSGGGPRQPRGAPTAKKGKESRPRADFKRDELPHAGRPPAPERSRPFAPDRRPTFTSSKSSPRDTVQHRAPPHYNGGTRTSDTYRTRSSKDEMGRPSPPRRDSFDKGRTDARDGHRSDRPAARPSFDSRSERRSPPYSPSNRTGPSYDGSPRSSRTETDRTWSPRRDSFDKGRADVRDGYRSERPQARRRSDSRSDHRSSQYPPSTRTNTESRRSEPQRVERSLPHLSLSQPHISSNSDTPTTFGNGLREDRDLEEGAYDTPEAADEFFHPSSPITLASSPPTTIKTKNQSTSILDPSSSHPTSTSTSASFTSPPLLPGFLSALKEMFGPHAQPTPIQSLSIAHCLPPATSTTRVSGAPEWRQFLLASETGSGKSIAYLLPLLQGVKTAELAAADHAAAAAPSPSSDAQSTPPIQQQQQQHQQRALNPRGLVLAPTHELARQLAGFAKALLHDVKLRVLCASRANDRSTTKRTDASAAQMAAQFAVESAAGGGGGEDGVLGMRRQAYPVGVVVGTPMKLLEMVRGRGWDRVEEEAAKEEKEEKEKEAFDGEGEGDGQLRSKPRRGRDKMVHYGTWRAKPELGLANVEWVVVDEADVLFDPDFQETTRTLLADISAARGHVLPASASIPVPPTLGQPTSPSTLSNPLPPPSSSPSPTTPTTTTPPTPTAAPIDYPFHLILTSATIPKSLNAYLTAHHPRLVRLASPRLHRLPSTLQTEYVGWTGGNKFADVVRRIRRVWAEDAASGHHTTGTGKNAALSKVLVFCNRSAKVEEFARYLEMQGVKSVAMTSRSEMRGRGSNRHLDGFLRTRSSSSSSSHSSFSPSSSPPTPPPPADRKSHPHVLITTSLLSRGLDFAPEIKHVFIVDEPRNTVDFLHRAGRTGRAGQWGKVVIFGKLKGRGSLRTKEVRKRIQGLRR